MDEPEQETMDGSPATVDKTLQGLADSGKFSHADLAADVAGDWPVIHIKFQAGPIKEVGVNGCSIEDVIDILAERLRGFQNGPFQCGENEDAIRDLLAAKRWLLLRTSRRQKQGVEGTNQPHVSAG